jgi:hypothetical protein
MSAFLTGSQRYGTPCEESDIDLVVPMDEKELDLMVGACIKAGIEIEENEQYDEDSVCLRFGKLNLLLMSDSKKVKAWRNATDKLIEEKPVRRERAIEVFRKEEIGI